MRNSLKFFTVLAFFSVLFFIYESEDTSAQGTCDCPDPGRYPDGSCFWDYGENNCAPGYEPSYSCPSKPLDEGQRCKKGGSCGCTQVCIGQEQSCDSDDECCPGLSCGTKSGVCTIRKDEQCVPKDTKVEGSCGNKCGSQEWTCDNNFKWRKSGCVNEGVCTPGQEDWQNCGSGQCSAQQRRTCNNQCEWRDWNQCRSSGWACGSCGTCSWGDNPVCTGEAFCGDNSCNCGEDANSCYTDCGFCGDGTCNGPEDRFNCGRDCGTCGDGYCDGSIGESCSSCSQDCSVSNAGQSCGTCGRGTYDSCGTCQGDYTTCGSQGWKNTGRTCGNLGTEQQFCDGCSWQQTQCVNEEVCGNGVCRGSENLNNCPQDCATCGDGTCSSAQGETCSTCAADCGSPLQGQSCGTCGNGVYDACGSCSGDFSVCGSQGWKNTGNSCQNCGTEQRFCDGCSWGSTQCANQGECAPGTNVCSGDILRSCSSSTCSYSDTNCNDQDGWYDTGSSYSCCQGDSSCSNCQDQEFRDYTCGAGACTYTVTNTQTVRNACSDCNSQDGWYATGRTQWIDDQACTQKQQREEEFRDYTCGAGSCAPTITQTRWIDTGSTQNKPDGISCDTDACTADSCQSGICQAPPTCDGSSTSCGCSACTNCDTDGTGAGRIGDGCLADGTYVDYQCGGTSCTSITTPNDPRCQQCSGNACRDPINNPGERCDGFKWVRVDGQETGAACDDGIDNDCDSHTDRGDASCIRVKQAESPDTVLQGTNFEVLCTSTGISNCLGANVIGPNDYSRECQFTGWEQTPFDFTEYQGGIRKIFNYYNHWRAKYTCYAENAGEFKVRCWLPNKPDGRCIVTGSPGEEGSPPGSEGDDNTTILPSQCTERTQTECPQDGLCQWCSEPSCQNTPGRFSVTAGTCIDITATCGTYACDADFDNNYIPDDPMCQAQCDDDTITCADTDCSSLDGCYLSGSPVSNSTCFGQTGCEFRDYINQPNSCDTAATCGCTSNQCIDPAPQQPDADLDGYDSLCDADCNDNNPNIYPGATDCCSINNLDVNCDGQPTPNCDKDGDGYIDENAQLCPWE